MGTRADFYVLSGKSLKQEDWIGSIAFDGYPDGIPGKLKKATSKEEFLREFSGFIKDRDDVTLPKDGWPWPWNDSGTTDYAYVFTGRRVYWDSRRHYPDMTKIQNVQIGGKKAGNILVTADENGRILSIKG